MFDKVLIANRGAIACRIIRTLKRLGVGSVAVYSKADAHSLHVRQADQAVGIGEAPASASYLDMERVLDAASQSGAKAIHPGYGFLSENASFAQACEERGICFLGPTPRQMRDFGLKHSARALAQASGLPLLPGSGLLDDVEQARREAARIGYPVMLKSTAGGGGIGMQLCRDPEALAGAFDGVQRLGRNNFANAGVFLERYVERARHVEVQIFGDGAGGVIALGRTGLLPAAAQPEGHRGDPGTQSVPRGARGHAGDRPASGGERRLPLGGHRRVHLRPANRRLLLP